MCDQKIKNQNKSINVEHIMAWGKFETINYSALMALPILHLFSPGRAFSIMHDVDGMVYSVKHDKERFRDFL